MVEANIPSFGVNYNTTFGTGFSVGENPAYYPFYENKIADGQQGINNQIAGFCGWDPNSVSPRFGNGDVINQQFVSESPIKNNSLIADKNVLVGNGFGIEGNLIFYSINIGWFTTGSTGALAITFSSGLSNSLGYSVYGANITSRNKNFVISNIKGSGVERSIGRKAWSFTNASNDFNNPDYYINQLSFGVGYYKNSGGVLMTKTVIIPTTPFLMLNPLFYQFQRR